MTAAVPSAPARSLVPKRYHPDLLLYLTIIFAWFSVWRFQELWPIIGKLQVSFLTEIALTAAFFTDTSPLRRLKWAKSKVFYVPFILLGIMVLGLPFNLYPGQAVVIIEKDFAPTLLLMMVVSTSMREDSDLDWFAFLHLVGAIVYSFWVYLYVPMGWNGRLGDLVYYDANDFGLLLVCTIPFAVYFLRPGVVGWKRLVALFGLALFVVMVMKTGSRGAFLGFIAVMAFILVRYRAVPARMRVGAVAGGVALLLVLGSSTYWNMMRSIAHPQDDYNLTDPVGRKAVWKRGIGYMLMRPVFGVGVGSFGQAEGRLSAVSKEFASENRGLKWSTAHNAFVLVGAELGLGGLIAFVFMIVASVRTLAAVRAPPQGNAQVLLADEAYAQMLIGSLIGYCVAGFFISASYFSYLYVIVGLVVAQQAVLKRRAAGRSSAPVPRAAEPTERSSRRQRFGKAHWAPAG